MTLTPFYSRLSALGILFLAGLFTWTFILSPLFSGIGAEQQLLNQNLERLSRYQALQLKDSDIRNAVENAEQYEAPVYSGPSHSAITAALQIDIRQFASDSGISLGSVRPVGNQPQQEGGYRRLALRVDMTGATTQLAAFLSRMRNHRQLMIVEKASLRALDSGATDRAAIVSMSFELVAFGEVEN